MDSHGQQPSAAVSAGPGHVSSNWRRLQGELNDQKRNGLSSSMLPGWLHVFLSLLLRPVVLVLREIGKHRKWIRPRQPSAPSEKEEGQMQPACDGRLTKTVAMDCEYVGAGVDGFENVLARVSIVSADLNCVYDKYVRPSKPVTDYRTAVSGIRPENVENAELFTVVKQEVLQIIKGRILVGHSINNDLEVLGLSHPRKLIRDTAKFKPFRKMAKTRFPKLRKLVAIVLGSDIQQGEHDSVEDSLATMKLYIAYRQQWEQMRKGRAVTNSLEPVDKGGKRRVRKKKQQKK